MAEVYKFNVKLTELEDKIWRDIEITSVSSIAKLAYSVLAAFEGTVSHLFNISYNGKRYEIEFEELGFQEPAINPITTKLESLKLKVGDTLTMEYDYGAGWEFVIKLISISEMKKGSGTHYPYVTDGQGKGIIEDTSTFELIEMINEIDSTGKLPKFYDFIMDKEIEWDYRKFDLYYTNMFLKDKVADIREAYEMVE